MFVQNLLWKELRTIRNTDSRMNKWINGCSRNTEITSCLSFVLTDTEWWMKSRSKIVLNLVSCRKNPTEFHLFMFCSLLVFTTLSLTSVLIVFCVGKTCHRVFQCASAKMKMRFIRQGIYLTLFSYSIFSAIYWL